MADSGPAALADRIRERIHRGGPLPFDEFVDAALYDPAGGFYATGVGAGRADRHFVTSPETGALFGLLVARALDRWWRGLGEPDPFVVVEVGAGRGALARDVLRAEPQCAPALRYVLVECSERLRAEQRALLPLEDPAALSGPGRVDEDDGMVVGIPGSGPVIVALDAFPAARFTGVVLANELLDNLPFALVEVRDGEWSEIRVGTGPDGGFVEVPVPLGERVLHPAFRALPEAARTGEGVRLPVMTTLWSFVAEAAARLGRGYLACVDYAESTDELVARAGGWLRTYRSHGRGDSPLDDPGTQDITTDVPVDAFAMAVEAHGLEFVGAQLQADWLRSLGVDALADEAAHVWRARAQTGDLAALVARSRVHEADALTDPTGLGAFRLLLARTSTLTC